MIYPAFIKKGDIIGITAPSDGITEKLDLARLDNAIYNIENKGFNILETTDVRKSLDGQSANEKIQAKELEDLFLNNDVKAIITPCGGDFMCKMMSYVNFDIMKSNPKWFCGYSDPTWLTYVITTKLDIATIYMDNFKGFGMKTLDESLKNNFDILCGKSSSVQSFNKYEGLRKERITGLEGYNKNKKVIWKNANNENCLSFSGRIIGGCLDVISEIFGTKFDYTKDFIERYKKDGIIWYFDNCDFTSEQVIRTLLKFRENGYFKYTNGIVFGRSLTNKSCYDISFYDAVKSTLQALNVPIIFDVDIGHVPPRMAIINGVLAEVISENGKGKINFKLV